MRRRIYSTNKGMCRLHRPNGNLWMVFIPTLEDVCPGDEIPNAAV